MPKGMLDGVFMMPFAEAMRKTSDIAAKAMSEDEFLVFCGYQYGLIAAGVEDARITDGAIAATQAVRFG